MGPLIAIAIFAVVSVAIVLIGRRMASQTARWKVESDGLDEEETEQDQ